MMAGANRIAGKGQLTPAKTIRFTFDGQTYTGLEGDTLASALLANGVHLVGRSFKYHRPRGFLGAGSEEPNGIMDIARDHVRRQPNVRATCQELYDGLVAKSQNRWPSLELDFGAVNSLASPLFAAGFYYKTFMWPKAAWKHLYEPFIRKAAGLGHAPTEADPDHYANRFAHCDVLVVGGGLAGLLAAKAAADSGADVIICDEQAGLGGALKYEADVTVDGKSGASFAQDMIAALSAMSNVRMLSRTTAFGYYAQNMVALAERVTDHLASPDQSLPRERLWQVRAKQVILATGAIERHMVFAENDRPGVMLASAGRAYLNQYGVAVGRRVGVYTANDSAYAVAFELKAAGIDVPALVDMRKSVDEALLLKAKELGIEVLTGHAVVKAGGRLRVNAMHVQPVDGGSTRQFTVDALLMSAGWTPSVHLWSQSRSKLVFDDARGIFVPGEAVQDVVSVGACNGTEDLSRLAEEAIAAGSMGGKAKTKVPKISGGSVAGGMSGSAPGAGAETSVKAFIDFQNDVTAKDIRLAVREGMHSIEHVKRFTTNGMASDQGKTSNMHGLAIAAEALGKPIPQVGLTTFRSPYTPVTFGTIVNHAKGPLFDPTRRTAMHESAASLGAVFEDVGQWKRAWYFPKAGEDMHQAVDRECKAVRTTAGIFDASTLGKIEVVGPDAAKFLNILYTNSWDKLGVGRCRYGIMLREDGYIYDDGVVGRIAEDRFHVTTTTGGAPRVMSHMEDYLQTEFPDMNVWLTSTSEQWAVIAVQGPKAREIITPFVGGMDLSNEAFPHMSVRECTFMGVPCRLFRMTFAGELGFEINVPADYGKAVWDAIYAHGAPKGLTPYGTEAMHVLRAEKGYIIVGQDTDGTVTPHDAGLSWAIAKSKPDFVGIRGLKRVDLVAPGRKQLVGLKTKDPKTVLEEGAQIVLDPKQAIPMKMVGHVTSSYWSENCGRSIAMALIEGGFEKMGQTIYVPMPDRVIEAEICDAVFYDKEGGRINV
jgi:sarcosine oxidase, subunit alpha